MGGERTATELVTAALGRLDRTEPDVRAWVRVDREGALAAARQLDSAGSGGVLRGMPVGVKDIIDVRGLPTECGSALRRGRIAESDAPVVARLRQLGAIPLGKTVTTEFAYFFPGPTRNPHDLEHTPGGSSSGSAAAVAAGVVPLALGSQTAGSLTRPAAFCGVAGFVAPAGGPLDTTGFQGLAPSLDAVGLLTPTVAGLRLAYAALAGAKRPADPTPAGEEHPAYSTPAGQEQLRYPRPAGVERLADATPAGEEQLGGPIEPPARPRLVVWPGVELGPVAAEMGAALTWTAEHAAAHGADLVTADLAGRTPRLVDAHTVIMAYEAARTLATEGARPDRLSAQLNELLATGRDTPDADYHLALSVAQHERVRILALLSDVDAILGPAALGPAPKGLASTGSPILSRPWQLLGLPALTVPGHRNAAGMPLGLQLIGHPDRLDQLFALGQAIEEAINTPLPLSH